MDYYNPTCTHFLEKYKQLMKSIKNRDVYESILFKKKRYKNARFLSINERKNILLVDSYDIYNEYFNKYKYVTLNINANL